MPRIEIIQTVDSSNFHARNSEELKSAIEKYFAEKSCAVNVEILSSDVVRIVFESSLYEKTQKNFDLAVERCNQGKFNAAVDFLKKGIKAFPAHSESHRLLGQIYVQQGEIDKGMDEVLEALLIDPKNLWALVMMGNIFAGKGDEETAERYFRKVLKYHPNNAIALNNIAGVYMQKQNFEKGILYMKRALSLDSTYTNSYYGLALAYYKKRELQTAFEYASHGVKKGRDRREDPKIRQEILKLYLTIAREICQETDYETKVMGIAAQIEAEYDVEIEFKEDSNQDTLAHLKFADFYHTAIHQVIYKRHGMYCHSMLHELMHLEMMLQAKQKGTLKR